jgi:hypothetical protein
MRSLTILGLLLTLAAQSIAQDSQENSKDELKKYKRRKETGIPLVILGGGLLIVSDQMDRHVDGNGQFQRSMAVTLLGAGSLGAGIPLWVSGARGMRKYKKKQESLTLGFHSSRVGGSGLTLRYRL